ncbi:MAG: tRNA preQ1(34) S-adenosylmethionine ribosyltransferase-isomerase QueA [Ancalomicrobiaceae bacterium]|nr:tRNA preQ1(34) S-adenosylmethionine ribosyltransferase-isomerase QueA [Ancalomicrobiaceae bacterium]
MRVDQFDFELPEDRIALRPAIPRDSARLLVVRPGGEPALADHVVTDLTDLLAPGDCLVFNDTKVIPAELAGVRFRGEVAASVSFNLHKRESANVWHAFARGAKKLGPGDRVRFGDPARTCEAGELWATVSDKGDGGDVTLAFDVAGPDLDLRIHAIGKVPLPPYIGLKRAADERDLTDYQTVYARDEGAVAAPTAGLHFTPDLIERLQGKGIALHFVTLHVGAGTFLPVKAEDTDDHVMHAEWGSVSPAVAADLEAARARGGRIVAVGTTSLRLLESAVDAEGVIRPFSGDTAIFITPGRQIRAVDALMTNFHLPRSTLFMLVSAFSGLDCMRDAYAHAIASGYRFYSYGDASLLFRASDP